MNGSGCAESWAEEGLQEEFSSSVVSQFSNFGLVLFC